MLLTRKGSTVWPKKLKVIQYWQSLPKSKQQGLGNPGNNTSYDHLVKVLYDNLVPDKCLLFEELAKKLNDILVSDGKPMTLFLIETSEKLIRFGKIWKNIFNQCSVFLDKVRNYLSKRN